MVKIERSFPAPQSLAMEAEKASGKYPDRKFDWNNLFFSCTHCNGIKNQKKYDDGIIDCCSEDPELLMDLRLIEGEAAVTPKEGTNEKTALTAALIWEVFNLRNWTALLILK